MTPKPLDGIRVLDLTHVLAGPYCTYQLHLLGAEVIKVESPRGDMVRTWGGDPQQVRMRLGTGFVAQNAGKRSLCVDLGHESSRQIVRTLAGEADVLVENYEAGTMAKFSLDYASLAASNPSLIYLSISALGQNGPYAGRPGFDDVVQATSGYMSVNVRGDGPIRTGGPVLDYATGMHAASSILAALLLKQRTGKGQFIDLAMQDVTMLLLNRNTSIAATTGKAPPPAGNRDDPLLGRYETKDGYVMLAGYLPIHCRKICAALGLDEYADLPTTEFRAHIDEIERAVEERLKTKTSMEWDEIFVQHRVVAGGVKTIEEVLASGQPAARGLLAEVHSAFGDHQVTTAGYRVDDSVYGPRGDVPVLGQHTREILGELGYSANQIQDLESSGAVISS